MGKEFDQEQTLTRKPKTKGFKKTATRLREGHDHLTNKAMVSLQLDRARVCDVNGHDADIIPISALKESLLKSRTAEALMTGPSAEHLEICYDAQTAVSQFYFSDDGERKRRIIAINPHRPRGDLLNTLSRELRRCWQHHQGALTNPLSYEPDEAILINRAQQADALMVSIRIAWELKLAHDNEAWDYLVGSPLADIGRTFEIKAQSDFRTLNNGEAARAAYDKFFEDSRTKMHDKRIIHQMLLDENGYMRTSAQRTKVSTDMFHRLGELPYGRNYLTIQSARSPSDMCYATVEDRSNANFLWFIKFERSFQEKELQMIQESVKMSAEIVDFAKWAVTRTARAE